MEKYSLTDQDKTLFYEIVDKNERFVDSETGNIISRKTAFLVAGGCLLTAAGIVSATTLFKTEEPNNSPVAIIIDETEVTEKPIEAKIIDDLPAKSFDSENAPVAETVKDEMSFNEAFAAARQELGPGGTFWWNGQLYGTYYENEVDQHFNPKSEIVNAEVIDDDEVIEAEIIDENSAADESLKNANLQSLETESENFNDPNFFNSEQEFDNDFADN